MNEETSKSTDIEELDRMEFEIFKKYWQPMMKELLELQELRDAVPEKDISVVKKMSDEIDVLRKGFEDMKGMLASVLRPQPQQQIYPVNASPYNPGLSHMPLYRAGQSFVVSPVQQAN